jgi:hypothetical protein
MLAFRDPVLFEPACKRDCRGGYLAVRVRPCPVAVIVCEEIPFGLCEVLEEVDERAARHFREL